VSTQVQSSAPGIVLGIATLNDRPYRAADEDSGSIPPVLGTLYVGRTTYSQW